MTEEKAQRMSPKLAPPDPKDGKEKPSRNLEMEGQRVRTINPSRRNRNTSARQLRGASKAEAKRSCSQKTVLTNTQSKRRQNKTETYATGLPESDSERNATGSGLKTTTGHAMTAIETRTASDALDRLTASGKQSESKNDGTGHESWPTESGLCDPSSIRRSGNTGGSRTGADHRRPSRLTTSQSLL